MRSSSFFWTRLVPPLCGFALLIIIWWGIALKGQIPTPYDTGIQAVEVFSEPFHRKGPNDIGIGWNMLASLKRVALGFALAAAVGIPLGFLIGRSVFMSRMLGPVIGVLRPVSPLAWLPIGLLVFKAADPAAIWTIAICSVWPLIINTATGVQRIPQDYLNVARVLNLSELKILTSIVIPAALPHILTGIRLAIGTAWLVIVAAEMLTGGVGIGFWVWDEWNNLNVKNIIIAIFIIGLVGLLLENIILFLTSKLTYNDVGNKS
jgi:nitrate/nitrite transport system permease protein